MHRFVPALLLVLTACMPALAPDEEPTIRADDDELSDHLDDADLVLDEEADDVVDEDTVDEDDGCTWTDDGGDEIEEADRLGTIDTPTTICGELYEAANDAGGYAGDLDFVSFHVPDDATYHLALSWEAEASDYDLYVFSVNDDGTYVTLADNFVEGNEYESVVLPLWADTPYVVGVAGWDGGAGTWTLLVE